MSDYLKWEDISSHNKKNIFELKTESIKIEIIWEHIHYPGEWIFDCDLVGISHKPLKLTSYKDIELAKVRSLQIVRDKLNKILSEIADRNFKRNEY